ncbi:hypothetical protein KKC1_20540 [Calderihabitans maritimus]|uniref:Flagellin n=1 Tax=Calderihabitans maritimus TaxID=1246530 RepID=A0A1Z5HU17_9FIRM|nr:hypothetical protein KKC1_20540 [Calderihabitans maritimus]
MRINRAADDAAGLAISEKMNSQVRGLSQAIRNAQDGISLIQTAEGGLIEIHSILQRMRELAVQASNETLTDDDRAQIQKEVDQLIAELDRIASSTEFNTKKLLNGTAGINTSAQNGTADGTNAISVGGGASTTGVVNSNDLAAGVRVTGGSETQAGVYKVVVTQTATAAKLDAVTANSTISSAGTLVINGYTVEIEAGDSLSTVATKINNISGQTGVTATYDANVSLATNYIATEITAFKGLDPNATYRLNYNNTTDTLALEKSTDGGTTWNLVGSSLNPDASSLWGTSVTLGSADEQVTVTLVGADPAADVTDGITITGGFNLATTAVGSSATINVSGENSLLRDLGLVAATDTTTTVLSDAGTDAQGTINGQVAAGVGNTLTLSLSGDAADGLRVDILSLNLDADGDGTLGTLTFDAVVDTSGRITVQIGANNSAEQRIDLDLNDMRASALGVEVVNVTDADQAKAAIDTIDAAIRDVSSERSKLGAFQNRLEHTITNLSVAAENITAARSRIRDVDMAKEMMEFVRNQIITQAATAMLAQANQKPQYILQLLR